MAISLSYINVNDQVIVTELQDYTEERQTDFERVSHSMQHIDTNSYSTFSGVSLSVISLTYINVNSNVTVTEPQEYTEE